MKYTCFICGYRTLDARCDWDICPICFWEDDVWVENEDDSSPANGMTVSEAQARFIQIGAVSEDMVQHVRAPGPEDEKDPQWKLLPKTLELFAKQRKVAKARRVSE